jgi:hypothetical protein
MNCYSRTHLYGCSKFNIDMNTKSSSLDLHLMIATDIVTTTIGRQRFTLSIGMSTCRVSLVLWFSICRTRPLRLSTLLDFPFFHLLLTSPIPFYFHTHSYLVPLIPLLDLYTSHHRPLLLPAMPCDSAPITDGFRPNPDESSQPLATSLQPTTNATLTIRIIKSFEYRTQRNLVLKGLDLGELSVGGLIERCREGERGLNFVFISPFR